MFRGFLWQTKKVIYMTIPGISPAAWREGILFN